MTGHHRSGDIGTIPGAKLLTVNLKEKETAVKKVKKAKTEVREKADFELVKQKEKRIEQLEQFQYVHQELKKSTSLRLALTDAGYSYDKIELAMEVVGMAKNYMSHKAYR